MNNIKLQQDLCNVIRQAIDQKDIMGANLLITKDDKEIAYCQEGKANAEQKRPIQRDTIFRLYSMTKPITATAAPCFLIILLHLQLRGHRIRFL